MLEAGEAVAKDLLKAKEGLEKLGELAVCLIAVEGKDLRYEPSCLADALQMCKNCDVDVSPWAFRVLIMRELSAAFNIDDPAPAAAYFVTTENSKSLYGLDNIAVDNKASQQALLMLEFFPRWVLLPHSISITICSVVWVPRKLSPTKSSKNTS